ncbi:hypothetical protein GCM10027566_32660 [Arachidicoccus ginsenosidivorans]|uniref:Lipocalin-like domain-containing protein n=1 Tax=Arachidicoccus ginsenosidivorans TaxID=496057 RepID=A0A5B8VKJ0_9BACT|nr:hypothetical protein [Arachidicoccus ginsenosidivorans]QEC71482.1 hypothetical protein FSB73_07165 [Arachidicoccus ginsenosidivorans]
MKNTFLKCVAAVAVLLCMSAIFCSCSKDEISQTGNKALLTAGKWELISATRTIEGGGGVTIDDAPAVISFTSAGHYRIYDDNGSVIHDVTYTFDDKNTISFDGVTFDMTTINSTNLTLVHTDATTNIIDTYNYKRKL